MSEVLRQLEEARRDAAIVAEAEAIRIEAYRDTMPLRVRLACRLGFHQAMPEPVRSGRTMWGDPIRRFECWCGRAYWLEDEFGRDRFEAGDG